MRSVFPLLVPPVVLALGLTACSPEPLASPAPETSTQEAAPVVEEPPTDPDLPSDADLRTYVDALASDSVSSLEAAQDLTEEGSPAANYLIYYLHNVNAEIDAGLNYPETSRIQDLEDGFELCSEVLDETFCTTYTNFVGQDGKISNFDVQGRDLSERLIMGTGETVEGSDGSEVEFVAAYRNAADSHLYFQYIVRSSTTPMYMPGVSYRNPDGRQSEAEDHVGAWDLAADSYSAYVATFPAGELGGEATVDLLPESGIPVPVTLLTSEE